MTSPALENVAGPSAIDGVNELRDRNHGLDLTSKISGRSADPVISSGSFCDIYTATMSQDGFRVVVALKRLRIMGQLDTYDEGVRKAEKVRVASFSSLGICSRSSSDSNMKPKFGSGWNTRIS